MINVLAFPSTAPTFTIPKETPLPKSIWSPACHMVQKNCSTECLINNNKNHWHGPCIKWSTLLELSLFWYLQQSSPPPKLFLMNLMVPVVYKFCEILFSKQQSCLKQEPCTHYNLFESFNITTWPPGIRQYVHQWLHDGCSQVPLYQKLTSKRDVNSNVL